MQFFLDHMESIKSNFGPNQEDIPEQENDMNALLFNR